MIGPDAGTPRKRLRINPGVLALVAASLWPFANFAYQNRGAYFSLDWLLVYFAIVLCLFGGIAAILSLLTRRPFARIAAPVAAFIILTYSYGAMKEAIPVPPNYIGYVWLAVAIVICTVIWFASRNRNALTAMFAAVLMLVALPIAGYLEFIAVSPFASADAATPPYLAAFVRKPNVYFMILDAYARADTLKEALGFDNQPFIDELRGLGFFVPRRSVSNYPATNASVGSILSLDYPAAAHGLDGVASAFRRVLLGHNVVVEKLKAEGYRYIVAPSGIWTKISCGGTEDLCIEKTRAMEMERALVSLTPLQLLSEKGAFRSLFRSTAEDYLEPDDLLRPLGDPLAHAPSPFFAMIHFGGVHDQIYESDCRKGEPGSVTLFDRNTAERYTDSVHCTNEQLVPLLKAIIARDPDAVILITGDHGPSIGLDRHLQPPIRPWTWGIHSPEDYRNQYSTMTGIRLPASCGDMLSDDTYAVNDFRIVFACLSDTRPKLLANQAWYFYFDDKRVVPVAPELMK